MQSQVNKANFPIRLAQKYIAKIDDALSENNTKEREDLIEEIVHVFSGYIKNITIGLDLYSYFEQECTYFNDLRILRGKLEEEIEIAGETLDETDLGKNGVKPLKLFISHSHTDQFYVEALVKLFDHIGLRKENMFCSSVPPYDVPLDEDIYEHLRKLMQTNELYVVFVLSDNFYKSPASLNEMGATWVLQHHYTSILLPKFDFKEIEGAVNPNKSAIKLDARDTELKAKLGELKDKLICLFGLNTIDPVSWEAYRDEFISKIKEICVSTDPAKELGKTDERGNDNESRSKVEGVESALTEKFYGKEIILHYTEALSIYAVGTAVDRKKISVALDDLYRFVSLNLTGVKSPKEFRTAISKYQPGYHVAEQDALIVRNKFEQLGLIESYVGGGNAEMIKLTEFGKKIMNELNQ